MADNIKVPASKIPKSKKILLYPGDPLIGVLNPDSYIIVNKGSLDPVQSLDIGNGEGEEDPGDGTGEGDDVEVTPKGAPRLEDITLISKTLVTDGNGNQFAEFKFNIKNSVGSEVVGVYGYGK
jgi:hypothetical protein